MSDDPSADNIQRKAAADYAALALRVLGNFAPVVGPALAEILCTILPRQRLDRLAAFATALEARISQAERDTVQRVLTDEQFTELVEEAVRQAARSTSDERRAYLATLVARGLTADDVTFAESQHLLRLLGELSDVQVIWLRGYREPEKGSDVAFRERHAAVFAPIGAHMQSPQTDLDRDTLRTSYREQMVVRGLLRHRYKLDPSTKQPMRDARTGVPRVAEYEITPLGRLLLRQIGLGRDTEA